MGFLLGDGSTCVRVDAAPRAQLGSPPNLSVSCRQVGPFTVDIAELPDKRRSRQSEDLHFSSGRVSTVCRMRSDVWSPMSRWALRSSTT